MIECTNCETAQFLQITKSRVYFEDGEMINEITERYECTLCEGTGTYVLNDEDDVEVTGEVEVTTERPRFA